MNCKFKVGDKVKVKKFKTRPFGWNSDGQMDHLMGKTVEIKMVVSQHSLIIWDEVHNRTWAISQDDVLPVNDEIVIHRKGSKVIAFNKTSGDKAVAKCNPEDEFNFSIGAKLAFDRLMGNVLEPNNADSTLIKAGDEVRIINTGKMYPINYQWVLENIKDERLRVVYAYGDSPYSRGIRKLDDIFVVRVIKDGCAYVQQAYYPDADRCYLIDLDGLKKC